MNLSTLLCLKPSSLIDVYFRPPFGTLVNQHLQWNCWNFLQILCKTSSWIYLSVYEPRWNLRIISNFLKYHFLIHIIPSIRHFYHRLIEGVNIDNYCSSLKPFRSTSNGYVVSGSFRTELGKNGRVLDAHQPSRSSSWIHCLKHEIIRTPTTFNANLVEIRNSSFLKTNKMNFVYMPEFHDPFHLVGFTYAPYL